MTWWAKNRMLLLLAITTITCSILIVPGAGILVSLPSLTGGPGIASPLSMLIPLGPMIVYCQGLARQNPALEFTSSRRIWYADLAVAALCLTTIAAGLVIDADAVMRATMRNALGYFGAALLGTWLFNLTTASLLPLIWAILALMGGLPLGNPSVTNWPNRDASDITSWIMAILLVVTGSAAYLAHHTSLHERLRQHRLLSSVAA